MLPNLNLCCSRKVVNMKYAFVVLFAVAICTLSAALFENAEYNFRPPDGSQLSRFYSGDEFQHRLHDEMANRNGRSKYRLRCLRPSRGAWSESLFPSGGEYRSSAGRESPKT